MKKLLKKSLALTLALGMGLSIMACSSDEPNSGAEPATPTTLSDFVPEAEGGYSFTVSKFNAFDSAKTYQSLYGNGKYALFSTIENKDGLPEFGYELYDMETYTKLFTSSDYIYAVDKGLFYSVDSDEGTYTIYPVGGEVKTYEGEVKKDDNVLYHLETGARTYVDVKGQVQTTQNPFEKILCYGEDMVLPIGGKYLQIDDNGNATGFEVHTYDANGRYEGTFTIEEKLNLSTEESLGSACLIDGKLVLQSVYAVPFDEQNYDYVEYGTKYAVTTYVYDVATDEVEVVENFGYLLTFSIPLDGAWAIAQVRKIENKKISANTEMQVINAKGEIVFDVQEVVFGADQFDVMGEYLYVNDKYGDVHVFKNDVKIAVIPDDYSFLNGYAYYEDHSSSSLTIYDLNNNYARTVVEDVIQVEDVNNTLVYQVNGATAQTVFALNTLTGQTTQRVLASGESLTWYSRYVIINKANGKKDLYIPVLNETMADYDSIEHVNSYSTTAGDTVMISAKKGDVVEYYVIVETEPQYSFFLGML